MNKNDKVKLLIVAFVLAYVLVAVGMIVGVKHIPIGWIIVITLAVQTFYVIPQICKLYYKANGAEAGVDRFIPFYQELCLFSPKIAKATLVAMIATGVPFVILALPTGMKTFLPEAVLLNYGNYCMRFGIVAIVAESILVGTGFASVFRGIKQMLAELSPSFAKTSNVEYVYYVLLFIPLIRCISLVSFFDKLNKLVTINGYSINTQNTELVEEEM